MREQTDRQIHWHLIHECADFLFQLNLLLPYSLCLQWNKPSNIFEPENPLFSLNFQMYEKRVFLSTFFFSLFSKIHLFCFSTFFSFHLFCLSSETKADLCSSLTMRTPTYRQKISGLFCLSCENWQVQNKHRFQSVFPSKVNVY